MNWIRFTNRLFGARIQINEPDRVQFETNEPLGLYLLQAFHIQPEIGTVDWWLRPVAETDH